MRFFISLILFCSLTTGFFSCKKDPNTTVVATPSFYFLNGGITNLDKTALLFSSSDTLRYNIVISSTYYVSSNTLVTVAAADQSRIEYNASFGTDYQQMPSGAYSFQDTITITPSSITDTITVTIYKHALTSDLSYMLPIQIVSAGNNDISPGSSVIYLHTFNSILSGIYSATGTKVMYNGDAADSNINSVDSFALIKSLVPENNSVSQLDYADLGANGWKYILGFSIEDSAFFALPNDIILNSVQAGSFKVLASTFDSTTKNIYIKTSYKNSTGNERIVEESLTLQ